MGKKLRLEKKIMSSLEMFGTPPFADSCCACSAAGELTSVCNRRLMQLVSKLYCKSL